MDFELRDVIYHLMKCYHFRLFEAVKLAGEKVKRPSDHLKLVEGQIWASDLPDSILGDSIEHFQHLSCYLDYLFSK